MCACALRQPLRFGSLNLIGSRDKTVSLKCLLHAYIPSINASTWAPLVLHHSHILPPHFHPPTLTRWITTPYKSRGARPPLSCHLVVVSSGRASLLRWAQPGRPTTLRTSRTYIASSQGATCHSLRSARRVCTDLYTVPPITESSLSLVETVSQNHSSPHIPCNIYTTHQDASSLLCC